MIDVINQLVNQGIQWSPEWNNYNAIEAEFLNATITNHLLRVPSVETVYVEQNADIVRVWTIVDDPAEHVYDQIYDTEKALINQFNSVRFDFSVVPRKGRETRSLITLNCPGWVRTEAMPKFNYAGY
jgi:hypothetical protein